MALLRIDWICTLIYSWVVVLCIILALSAGFGNDSTFFRFGPHEDFVLFGVTVDTPAKYFGVVLYCLIGSIMRTLQTEILKPWIIQEIQNHNPKSHFAQKHAYLAVGADAILTWVDWLMYINILLAQIDMVIVETIWNIIISFATARKFLQASQETAEPGPVVVAELGVVG